MSEKFDDECKKIILEILSHFGNKRIDEIVDGLNEIYPQDRILSSLQQLENDNKIKNIGAIDKKYTIININNRCKKDSFKQHLEESINKNYGDVQATINKILIVFKE